MLNEILFFSLFIALASVCLLALRLGKSYLYGLIAALAVLMNIFVLKPFTIFGITTYGGNAMYGCIFLATDLLAEYYGKKEALKAVRIGFLSLLVYFITSIVYLKITVFTGFDSTGEIEYAQAVQSALETIFTPAYGIVIASFSAFLVSNTCDVYFFEFIKNKTGKKFLWIRNNISTLFSQFLDTVIFTTLAASFGVFAWEAVWEVIAFAYIFKLMVAVLDTPFIYLSKLVMKNVKHEA
jgi:uncharacterized integral membrane protein (TIGR00697 family)